MRTQDLRITPPFWSILVLFGTGLSLWLRTNHTYAQEAPNSDPPSIVKDDSVSKPASGVDIELSIKVTALLDELQNGSEQERAEAEKSLVKLGPAVLAHLPRLRSSVEGDFRIAIDRVRDSLQSKAIGEYAVASQITLQGKLPVVDVILEIMEQSDNQLTMDTPPARDIDVNFQKATFWEALDFVLDELKFEVSTSAQDGSLKLAPSDTAGTRVTRGSYAGVFRLEPNRVDATRSIRSNQLNHMSVEVSIAWEPRLRPVFFKFPMKELLIECDNGEILEAAHPDASPEYTPTDSNSIDASLMVELPSREAKRIRRMSGSLITAIPGATVQLEFDELEKPGSKSQKVGNLSVAIEETKKREEIYEFKILISLREAGQTMDSFRGWLMSHEAYLMDADDKRIENAGWQTYQMNAEAVGLTYFFDVGESLKGCRLIYAAPGAVTEQRVDFLLKDIPLP